MVSYQQYAPAINLSLKQLIEEWNKLCEIEKDVHIILAGGEGDGKSQTACKIVKRYPDTNFWDNIVYTSNPKELYDKYSNLPQNSIMVLDEALNSISRQDWNSPQIKALVKFFRTVVRKEKFGVWIYNTQLLRDLHGFWRNHRCTWLLEMGIREFYEPNVNGIFVFKRHRIPVLTGKRDVWLLDNQEVMWLERLLKEKITGISYANLMRNHPFYYGEMLLAKIPDEDWEEYNRNRKKAYEEYSPDEQKPIVSRKIEKLTKEKRLLIELCIQHGISHTEIAKKLGIGLPALTQFKHTHFKKNEKDENEIEISIES